MIASKLFVFYHQRPQWSLQLLVPRLLPVHPVSRVLRTRGKSKDTRYSMSKLRERRRDWPCGFVLLHVTFLYGMTNTRTLRIPMSQSRHRVTPFYNLDTRNWQSTAKSSHAKEAYQLQSFMYFSTITTPSLTSSSHGNEPVANTSIGQANK